MSDSNLTKVSKYLLINSIFTASLYYGYVESVEGAENIALAIAWFIIIVSWLALSDEFVQQLRKNPSITPKWIDQPFDLAVASIFFWFGAEWTGAFYLLHIILFIGAQEKAKEPANNEKE